MPAHPTTVPEYCDVLAKSKLLPEGDVTALLQKWRADGHADADVESFRKGLIARRLLTEYQAALVARGRADGFSLGGYVILDRLGRGAMAGVYKAAHTSGQIVALKVLPPSKAKDANSLSRFQREGRLLCQLDHPNVVRAFQVGQAGSVHFIVMEHLDGETLDEVLARRKRLPLVEAVRVAFQALAGLQHLHERRMVHRDLKPANLMVTPPPGAHSQRTDTTLESTVKILDIGIGRELFADDSTDTTDKMLTTEGTILGTPDYLAPEQARDARSADVRADVYSMGCVLFHLITGRTPFPEKNVLALTVKHATEKLPTLADLVPDVPPMLQTVLDKMTAKKPEERYPTPGDAAEALRPFLPDDATAPSVATVLPGYKLWLETDTGSNLPVPSPPAKKSSPAVIVTPSSTKAATKSPAAGPAPKPVATTKPAAVRPSGSVPPIKPATKSTPVLRDEDTIDVELVPPEELGDERSLVNWSRRDHLLLAMGAGAMLAAVALGFGLSQLLRSSPPVE